MKRSLTLAALLLTFTAAAAPTQARVHYNGIYLNGIQYNAVRLNGLNLNGVAAFLAFAPKTSAAASLGRLFTSFGRQALTEPSAPTTPSAPSPINVEQPSQASAAQ